MIMGYRLILCGAPVIAVFFLISRAIAKRIIEKLVKEQGKETGIEFSSIGHSTVANGK